MKYSGNGNNVYGCWSLVYMYGFILSRDFSIASFCYRGIFEDQRTIFHLEGILQTFMFMKQKKVTIINFMA